MEKEKIRIQWGIFPRKFRLAYLLLSTVSLSLALYLIESWQSVAVIAGVFTVLYLMSFLHFVVTTKNYYIFFYGWFFIVRKRTYALIKPEKIDDVYSCICYYIGEKRPLLLFYNHKRKAMNKQKELKKDKTNYTEYFEKTKRNAIEFKITEKPSFNKMGGVPNLPLNFVWPTYKNEYETIVPCEITERPLSFMLQVNIKDLKPYDKENLLPNEGVLSVFYDNLSQPLGENIYQMQGLKIYYFNEKIEDLKPTKKVFSEKEWDSDGVFFIKERFFEISNRYEIQSSDEYEFLSKKEISKYFDEAVKSDYYIYEWNYKNKLFGYANDIQGSSYSQVKKYDKNLKDYILLMQIKSIGLEPDDFNLGDNGHLYIYIKKDDLKNLNFENIIYYGDFY